MAAGRKTGGRKAGTPNRTTAQILAEIQAGGEMPLEYMLRVMRDPKLDNDRRDRAAHDAARFCHATLTAFTPLDGAQSEESERRLPVAGSVDEIVARFMKGR